MAIKMQSTKGGREIVLDYKIGIIVALVLICGALTWWGITQYKIVVDSQDIVKQTQKQLMEKDVELGKAKTEFGNAQAELKKMSDDWQQWIKEHGGKAEDVAYWRARYETAVSGAKGDKIEINIPPAKVTHGSPGVATGSCPLPVTNNIATVDHVDSLGKYIWLDRVNDGNPDTKTDRVVLSYKDYRVDITVDALQNLFSYVLHQNFEGEFVKAVTREGAVVHFLRMWEVDDKGKRVKKIDIPDFRVVTELPEGYKSRFFWWNPKIDAGVNFGVSSRLQSAAAPEFGFSVATKGKTKDDSDWRFIRFSVAQNRNQIVFNFSPACWNDAKKLPLLEKLYVCPTIGQSGSDTTIGVGLNTNF